MITDTESTHGTYVNDSRLGNGRLPSHARELKNGDVVSFGKDVLREHSEFFFFFFCPITKILLRPQYEIFRAR